MLTLFHAPASRSTRVVALLKELDALDRVRVEVVSTARIDGTGRTDPRNPHPEGKVPLLVHDGVMIRESAAIVQYLAELFPEAGLNVPAGHRLRGAYLSWFAYYAGVVEPVMALDRIGLDHPGLRATFRTRAEMEARLAGALQAAPYLLGDRFTAADLLLHSPYAFFGKPGVPAIDAWVDRCTARPGAAWAAAFDAEQGAA